MDIRSHTFDRIRRFFGGGLDVVEYAGLLVIAFATTVAMYQETMVMIEARRVTLAVLEERVLDQASDLLGSELGGPALDGPEVRHDEPTERGHDRDALAFTCAWDGKAQCGSRVSAVTPVWRS